MTGLPLESRLRPGGRSRLRPVLPSAFLFALLAASPPSTAGESQSLLVTATVRERTVVRVLSAPATLRVTPEDLARGAVDGEVPVQVVVETNAPEGARLALSLAAGPAQGVRLSGLGPADDTESGRASTVQAGVHPAVVHVPRQGTGRQRRTLTWHARFALRPDAQPGVYEWPLQVQPLPRSP